MDPREEGVGKWKIDTLFMVQLSTVFEGVTERFPRSTQNLSIFSVHVFRMELQFNHLPNEVVQIAGL
jgi:hypothetical protein